MKAFWRRIKATYFAPDLGLRVQLFNILAVGGILVTLIATVTALANQEPPMSVLAIFIGGPLSYLLMRYASRTGNYYRCYLLTVFLIFLILFPIIFFSGGGYHGAMPSFFIFAVLFTIFMLDGKAVVLLSALELLVYIGLCVYGYYNPQSISPLGSELLVVTDIVIGFTLASIVLGICLRLHFRLHNIQQRQLAERNAVLDAVNHQKSEFLSNISHELKTPLTVVNSQIQLGIQTLAPYPELEETQQRMKLISGEMERMGLMVSQILDASRIDEGRMQMETKRESIIEIIQSTLNVYYPVFSKNYNQLLFRWEGSVPAVQCDRLRVMQVLVNLIGNAVRHTHNGEIVVSVGASEEKNEAVVCVADTGEGIAAERIPYLFDRYHSYHSPQQHAQTRAGRDTGTGLGLYICKHIVERHGGRIWIESELESGTQVYFTLPLEI
jgi:Signal transduction histidine kinase